MTVTAPDYRVPAADLIGSRVSVHLNLQTGQWSIAEKPNGRVLAYADAVTVTDATFKVYEATRQYTITHHRRRVHAYCVGVLAAVDDNPDVTGLDRVTYNPFRGPTFTAADAPIHHADRVTFAADHYGYTTKETR